MNNAQSELCFGCVDTPAASVGRAGKSCRVVGDMHGGWGSATRIAGSVSAPWHLRSYTEYKSASNQPEADESEDSIGAGSDSERVARPSSRHEAGCGGTSPEA